MEHVPIGSYWDMLNLSLLIGLVISPRHAKYSLVEKYMFLLHSHCSFQILLGYANLSLLIGLYISPRHAKYSLVEKCLGHVSMGHVPWKAYSLVGATNHCSFLILLGYANLSLLIGLYISPRHAKYSLVEKCMGHVSIGHVPWKTYSIVSATNHFVPFRSYWDMLNLSLLIGLYISPRHANYSLVEKCTEHFPWKTTHSQWLH